MRFMFKEKRMFNYLVLALLAVALVVVIYVTLTA